MADHDPPTEAEILNTYEPEDYPRLPGYLRNKGTVRCLYCGKAGLHWVELPEGWRTHEDSGGLHRCERKQ